MSRKQNGTLNSLSKLNENKVFEMRQMRAGGAAVIEIALKFKINEETARGVVQVKSWAHVKTPYDAFLKKNHRKLSIRQTEHNGLTAEFVRRVFKYDPKEGILRWNIRGQAIPYGERAGSLANGHYMVGLWDKGYYTGPLIWLYMTGEWPDRMVDHKDGNKTNDKWSNLRLATRSQNGMNAKLRSDNKTGCKGVYPSGKRFKAVIFANKIAHYLGYFDTFEQAVAARRAAEKIHHGEFARTK